MIKPIHIQTLFKLQLDKIQEKSLRQSVVETWVLVCKRGNWKSIKALNKVPFTLMTETHGINIIEHTIAVTEGAAALARTQIDVCKNLPYRIDLDLIYAGGLLHDVGKLIEIEQDSEGRFRVSSSVKIAGHTISGAQIAAEAGIPEKVQNIILSHSKDGENIPRVIEAVLVHHADFAAYDPLVMKKKGLIIE